jgi:hypothetical protein
MLVLDSGTQGIKPSVPPHQKKEKRKKKKETLVRLIVDIGYVIDRTARPLQLAT